MYGQSDFSLDLSKIPNDFIFSSNEDLGRKQGIRSHKICVFKKEKFDKEHQ